MPPPLFHVAGQSVFPLGDEDAPALQTLLENCPDYFNLIEGAPAAPDAALQELHAHPPDCPSENITCLGLSKGEDLVGVICALRDYPRPNHWYLGLMLLHPESRGKSLGAAFYQAFESHAAAQGATAILLSVVESNPRASAFWQRQNFAWPRCYRAVPIGQRTHLLTEYEKRLSQPQ